MTRELDALIAEKIFGWHVERFVWGGFEGEVWMTDPSRKDEPPSQRMNVTINPKPFSTDITAAWTIVEHMRDLWTEATDGASDINLPGHFRSFIAPFDDGAFFDVLHRNADRRWPYAFLYVTPEAICRAALAALAEE